MQLVNDFYSKLLVKYMSWYVEKYQNSRKRFKQANVTQLFVGIYIIKLDNFANSLGNRNICEGS